MNITDDILELFAGSLPADVFLAEEGRIIFEAAAEVFTMLELLAFAMLLNSRLGTSTNHYIDMHGVDRDVRRQNGETNDQFRERLRQSPKLVTLPALLEKLNAIVENVRPSDILELPRNSVYADRASSDAPSVYSKSTEYLSCTDIGSRCGGGRGVVVALIPSQANAVGSATDAMHASVAAGKLVTVQEYDDSSAVERKLILYPISPSVMTHATGTGSGWNNAWSFDELEGDALGLQNFGGTRFVNPGVFSRVQGMIEGSAVQLTNISTARWSAASLGSVGLSQPMCVAMLVKFDGGNYGAGSVIGYGSPTTQTWFLVHGGSTATTNPSPGQVRFTAVGSIGTGIAQISVPLNQWMILLIGIDRTNARTFVSWANDTSDGVAFDGNPGSIASSRDVMDIGETISPFAPAHCTIDRIYTNFVNDVTDPQAAAQNLWAFITRTNA